MNDTGSKQAEILIAESSPTQAEQLKYLLENKGYKTACARNGREALAYLRSAPRQPGLILLDLMMPEMTGWEFRKIQQADPELAAIPVAIITGIPGMEDKASAIGAVDVLAKPSRVEQLTELVSRFCGGYV